MRDLLTPMQLINNSHVLRNNVSRCLRRTMVRNYVRCDVDIRSESLKNKLPVMVPQTRFVHSSINHFDLLTDPLTAVTFSQQIYIANLVAPRVMTA